MRTKLAGLFVLAALAAPIGTMAVFAAPASAEEVVGEPTVMTEGTSGVGRTVATVNALVNPNGSLVEECEFEYGTSKTTLTKFAPCSVLPGSGENDVTVSAVLEDLTESQEYYFRITATNSFGAAVGDTHKFMTLPTEPKGHTEEASLITKTSAQFNAVVNPDDATVTKCEFEYGATPSYELGFLPCATLPGSGERLVHVYTTATGLTQGTKYYYRLKAVNSFNEFYTGPESFSTFPYKPKAVTGGTSEVTEDTAILHGTVNPDDSAITKCEFEWGPSKSYGEKAPCTLPLPGAGESPEPVTASLSGLSPSTAYYYRIVAENAVGSRYGYNARFTTLPSKPKVATKPAEEVTGTSAKLAGTVNPDDSLVTTCEFEWGPTQSYGEPVAMCTGLPGSPGEGSSGVSVSAPVTGLTEGEVYNYRLVAGNGFGSGYGGNVRFTSVAPVPAVTKLSPKKGPLAGGTLVTIKGAHFLGEEEVLFGSVPAVVTNVTDTLITAESPAGSGTVDVRVKTPGGTSPITAKDHFKYKG